MFNADFNTNSRCGRLLFLKEVEMLDENQKRLKKTDNPYQLKFEKNAHATWAIRTVLKTSELTGH